MSNEAKQLRLQLKERDARISQLEASKAYWKTEYKDLEAKVSESAEVFRKAKEILNAYTTGLQVIAAITEQTKESSGKAEA